MAKLKGLKNIADNLADSFVSTKNLNLLKNIEHSPHARSKFIVIDVLKKKISPKELVKVSRKALLEYNDWFLEEIDKLDIPIEDIEEIILNVSYKPGKSFARYYTCNVTIKAKGKEYTGKAFTSYD